MKKDKKSKKTKRNGMVWRMIVPILGVLFVIVYLIGINVTSDQYAQYGIYSMANMYIIFISSAIILILLILFAIEGKRHKWVNAIFIIIGIYLVIGMIIIIPQLMGGASFEFKVIYTLFGIIPALFPLIGGVKGLRFIVAREADTAVVESSSNVDPLPQEEVNNPSNGENKE